MELPAYFISCDWGTSNFRSRLVHTETLEVRDEIKTDQGVKALYDAFRSQNEVDQSAFFSDYLCSQLEKLDAGQQAKLVVITGMASSNIGLKELPYGQMPFDGTGNGLYWEQIPLKDKRNILLISGVKGSKVVMRGEEMQAVGLSEHLKPFKEGKLVLPGTHSKHLTYWKGHYTEAISFMTGELFGLLSQKSILANNVEASPWSHARQKAFLEGLQQGFKEGLALHLFAIRAQQLLEGSEKKDNYYLLSGLLIGDELAHLKEWNGPIFLAAPEPFLSLYQLALETLIAEKELVFLGGDILENALLVAQRKIISLA